MSNFTLNSVTGEISYIGTGTSEGDIQYLSITATTLNGEATQIDVLITQDGTRGVTETNTSPDEVFDPGENLTSSAAIRAVSVNGTSSYYDPVAVIERYCIDSTTGVFSYDGNRYQS